MLEWDALPDIQS